MLRSRFQQVRTAFVATMLAIGIAMPSIGNADVLVANGKITKILSTRSANDPSFVIFVEGGTGTCANGYVFFYPSGASNLEMQKRSLSIAMMAMTTGLRVTIEAVTTSCLDAYVITAFP